MVKGPKVSVVVPTYNRASCIKRTIDSVLAQTYNNYEIIVVDDGSTDETLEVLGRYGNAIRHIYQQNSGVSVARNTGILASAGEWVAFLDSDDEWMPTKLEKQVQITNRYPSIVASVTNATIVLSDQTEIDLFNIRGFQVDSLGSLIVNRPLSDIIELEPFTPSLFVLREVLLSVGLFDRSMTLYEDHDLMCRVALKGPWAITGESLVRVFRHGDAGVALSMQQARDPQLSARNLGKTCLKLLTDRGLTRKERRLIHRRLSGCRFDEGICLYQGDTKKARKLFFRSFTDYPSLKSVLRLGLVLCLGLKGLELLKRYRSTIREGFRRSDLDQVSLSRDKGTERE